MGRGWTLKGLRERRLGCCQVRSLQPMPEGDVLRAR
jgi:hypothetical protein